MPEKTIAILLAKVAEYWDAILAVIAGIVGGGLAYLAEVKNGTQKWDLCAFALAIASAGFFAFVTYMICVEMFAWSPGLSVAASGMIAHLGAEKVKQLLTQFFTSKLG
ncbi:phage holin family protein [Marinobacter adhaerens]|uniref:phage holin family protein n=1 Tax=Marinobacter adhaerens TaxID=1033846 RepID=UPI001C5E2576|nr:phage holin family protein [Marinobacter adhaerens]MBW4978319.1 phage holin family protein [Marinobacter adhaerens]